MEDTLKLTIITPDREFYEGEISEIITENELGKFGILPNHVAMSTVITPSITTFVEKGGEKKTAFTSSGILNVEDNVVKVLCDAAEWPEEINKERAEEAKARAEMRLKQKDGVDLKRAEFALMRALIRLKVKSS